MSNGFPCDRDKSYHVSLNNGAFNLGELVKALVVAGFVAQEDSVEDARDG